MILQLNVTVATIIANNHINTTDVELFRVVNYFSPRNWTFSFTFDAQGRNILDIKTTPGIEDLDIQKLLNGELPILYKFAELKINTSEGVFQLSKKIEEYNSNQTTLEFSKAEDRILGSIQVVGFKDVDKVQKTAQLQRWFLKSTWLGAFEPSTHQIKVNLFGNELKIHPPYVGSPKKTVFQKRFRLEGHGSAIAELRCSPEFEENLIRHKRYGEFTTVQAKKDFWSRLKQPHKYQTHIEIDVEHISWYSELGPTYIRDIKAILEAVQEKVLDIQRKEDFRKFVNQLEENDRHAAATKLTDRQLRLQVSRKVSVDNRVFLKEPTSENELVALFMKLEASQNLPAPIECVVMEYTPKQGIDALGKFRFSTQDNWTFDAPIEFEHMFSSYLKHKHPGGQTTLIICWSFESDYLKQCGCHGPYENEFVKYVSIDGHRIPVIVVSMFPNIQIN
jgi:hypothetical protein